MSWLEILVVAVALGCMYVAWRLCHEGYGLLRIARIRLERRIARLLVGLGYLLGLLVVLAGLIIISQWF